MNTIAEEVTRFYADVMSLMQKKGIPFLVGGAFAYREYTGIFRWTKDFDFFVRHDDVDRILQVAKEAGYQADYMYPHWIAKIHKGEAFIDLIFRAGNGLCEVTETWFDHARKIKCLELEVDLCPPEELILMKSYVMDRGRFDGADIAHMIRACGPTLDWDRLAASYGDNWHVLLCHLTLFGFVYPGEVSVIPELLYRDLLDRARAMRREPPIDERVCRGPLLSRGEYQHDIEQWDYKDARQIGEHALKAADIEKWTNAVD